MNKEQIQILFKKYIDKTISDEELEQLALVVGKKEEEIDLEKLLRDYFEDEIKDADEIELKSLIIQKNAWSKIEDSITQESKPNSYFKLFSKIAATILLFVVPASIYFVTRQSSTSVNNSAYRHDIQPGTNRATLTVANGKKYELKGTKQGIVAGGNNIYYSDGEVLANAPADQNITLTTPMGGKFRVTLSDGTKVWLNAASSLTYPENFTGTERKVTLEGEAYFEVTHNAQHPFIVRTNGQQIKVLGTSFNVNAYKNEPKTVTTLLTGRVQLSNSRTSSTAQLHPGEQAVFDQSGFEVGKVDASIYSAWKDGEFRFKATPLLEVLRQVERWYDLDIDYRGIPADIQIHASISRDKQLSSVLHALERITDLRFDVRGRKLTVVK